MKTNEYKQIKYYKDNENKIYDHHGRNGFRVHFMW